MIKYKWGFVALVLTPTLSVFTSSVFALTPWNGAGVQPANTFNQTLSQTQVYISGSSDQNSVLDLVVRDLCVNGSLDVYSVLSTSGGEQTVYSCNVKPGSALVTTATPANTPIWIHKESQGGSANGIGPVADATPLQFVDISQIVVGQSQCTVASYVETSGTLAAKRIWRCPTTMTVNAVPQIGISDIEPALLGLSTTGTAGTLNIFSPMQMTMGLAVTKPLRDALQGAQGLTVGGEDALQQPTLSNASMQRLFWTSHVNIGATLGITGTDSTRRIFPIRRGSNTTNSNTTLRITSGNQKLAEAYLFNQNIAPEQFGGNVFINSTTTYNGLTVANDTNCGTATAQPNASTVFGGRTSEQVVNCLNRHAAGGRFAVAILPLTFNAMGNPASGSAAIDSAYSTGFRYIKLNGYLPTLENVIRDNYSYYAETVIASLLPLSDTSAAGAVLNALSSKLSTPAFLATIDGTFTRWTDLPANRRNSGLTVPGRISACKATFAALGSAPDIDPVGITTKNPTTAKVNNAVPPIAVCPPRY